MQRIGVRQLNQQTSSVLAREGLVELERY